MAAVDTPPSEHSADTSVTPPGSALDSATPVEKKPVKDSGIAVTIGPSAGDNGIIVPGPDSEVCVHVQRWKVHTKSFDTYEILFKSFDT